MFTQMVPCRLTQWTLAIKKEQGFVHSLVVQWEMQVWLRSAGRVLLSMHCPGQCYAIALGGPCLIRLGLGASTPTKRPLPLAKVVVSVRDGFPRMRMSRGATLALHFKTVIQAGV